MTASLKFEIKKTRPSFEFFFALIMKYGLINCYPASGVEDQGSENHCSDYKKRKESGKEKRKTTKVAGGGNLFGS